MAGVLHPRPRFFSFNLLSKIDTKPVELGNHCPNLGRAQLALRHFKFFATMQMFNIAPSH